VDVMISHCGICGSDLHQLKNAWGVACFPLVPGHEIVGEVVKLGPGVDKFKVGARVGIGVQRGNCGKCANCKAKLEHICPKITKTYAGPGKDKGGFAQYIRYPAEWTFPVPDSLPSEYAAPLLCAGITTFSPLKRYCKPGMAVGVVGVGGLGHLGIQFAKEMGCTVAAISTGDSKREQAMQLGASTFIVSKDADQMKANVGTLDVILNTSSGIAGMDGYCSLLKPRGVMACVSLPEKDAANMTKMHLQSLVITEKSLCGSYLGPKEDYAEMLTFAAKKKIWPMIEKMPYADVNKAVEKVEEGSVRYRMVLEMPHAAKMKPPSPTSDPPPAFPPWLLAGSVAAVVLLFAAAKRS